LGNYNVGSYQPGIAAYTFNAPTMNAFGNIDNFSGAAAAARVFDTTPTLNQFFNGVSVGLLPTPALPPPLPPPPPIGPTIATVAGEAASGTVSSIAGQLRSLSQAGSFEGGGVGFSGDVAGGTGFEVGISAHEVDWDDPISALPVKPEEALVDLEEYFSGKRARRPGGDCDDERRNDDSNTICR
ncbi:MAG: hypothetical protein JO021_06295, partial [Alphaproteobacteria bacterium]|nr:hypothetical protein [Alphaproteobacteria bacterium]